MIRYASKRNFQVLNTFFHLSYNPADFSAEGVALLGMWDVPTCSEAPLTERVDFLLIDRLTLGLLCPVDDLSQINLSYNCIVKNVLFMLIPMSQMTNNKYIPYLACKQWINRVEPVIQLFFIGCLNKVDLSFCNNTEIKIECIYFPPECFCE